LSSPEDKPQPEAELDPAELEQQQPLPSAAIEIPKPPWAEPEEHRKQGRRALRRARRRAAHA
jgi:hypothetical protein